MCVETQTGKHRVDEKWKKRKKKIKCLQHPVFPGGHPSSNRARRCLTSVIGREPVFHAYGDNYQNRMCWSNFVVNMEKWLYTKGPICVCLIL